MLPPPGAGNRHAAGNNRNRAPPAFATAFTKSRKSFKHDNTFAPTAGGSVSAGQFRSSRSPTVTRKKFTDFDRSDSYDYQYSSSRETRTTDNGPSPHIKGVHTYIFSPGGVKRDYGRIADDYVTTRRDYGKVVSDFLTTGKPVAVGRNFADFAGSGLDLGGVGVGQGPSAYEARVSAKSAVYQGAGVTPGTPGSVRRSTPTGGHTPSLPGRRPPVRYRSPSPVWEPPPPTRVPLRRRSPPPVNRTQIRPELVAQSYASAPPPPQFRPVSPSPVRKSFSTRLAEAQAQYGGHGSHLPRRYSVTSEVSSSTYRNPWVFSKTPRRHSASVTSSRPRTGSLGLYTSRTPAAGIYTEIIDTEVPKVSKRKHYTPTVRRVPQSSTSTIDIQDTYVQHAPVYAKRFPTERYTLVKSPLRPVRRTVPDTEDVDWDIVPYLPRYLGRRHSLDAGVSRMGVDMRGAVEVYRETTVSKPLGAALPPTGPLAATTTTTISKKRRPLHPPITRPASVEKTSPLYDVDLYYITRQQLIDQPDVTSKFQPLKTRLQQIGTRGPTGGMWVDSGEGRPPPPYGLLPGARALSLPGPGEIPYYPARAVRRRPGGPLYIHSVGEDATGQSELEPRNKDGVVCVMVRSLCFRLHLLDACFLLV